MSEILVFFVGLAGSFVGAIAGGSGLIIIPFFIFLGLPPHTAIATHRLGAVGQLSGSLFRFRNEGKILWKYVPLFCLLALIGSYFGATLLFRVNEDNLTKIIGILLLAISPLIFLKKDLGLKRLEKHGAHIFWGFAVYFLIEIYGGFLGTGSGIMIFYALMYFFGLTIIESNATSLISGLVSTFTSLAVFASAGAINYRFGFILTAAMFLGSYLGTHVVLRKGEKWVKDIFAIMVLVFALKLLFS